MNAKPCLFPLLLLSLMISASAQDHLIFEGKDGPGKGKQVVLIAGDEEYRSEEAMPMLAKILSQRHGFTCTVLFSADAEGTIQPAAGGSLSNSAALDKADLILMSIRFRHWSDEAMARFDNAYKRGVPMVALRTSTHGFNMKDGAFKKYSFNAKDEWAGGFGKQVLGETWVAHHGAHKKEGCRGIVEVLNKDHPLLRSVENIFVESDVYTANPPADALVLMRGQVTETLDPASKPVEGKKNDPMQPIVWLRERVNEAGKTNRICTTTMGAATDLINEGLRRLVVNSVYWGLALEIPMKADVSYVDPYAPSFFGFKTERKNFKVIDQDLGKALPARTGDDGDVRPNAVAPKPK